MNQLVFLLAHWTIQFLHLGSMYNQKKYNKRKRRKNFNMKFVGSSARWKVISFVVLTVDNVHVYKLSLEMQTHLGF